MVSRARGLCSFDSDRWMGDVELTVAALSRSRKPSGKVVVAVRTGTKQDAWTYREFDMTDQTPSPATDPLEPAQPVGGDLVPTKPGSSGPKSEPVVRQLDSIIENLAGYAVPVLREIAARAADLAAKAGQAAGPIAQKAADKTEEVGGRLATKGREVAADMRRDESATTVDPPTSSETQEHVATEAGLPPR